MKREKGTCSKKGKLAIVAQSPQARGAATAEQRRVANAWSVEARRGEGNAVTAESSEWYSTPTGWRGVAGSGL